VNSQPPVGCTINLPNDSDINNWEVTMQGPAESVYAVRLYTLSLKYHCQY
jgi:ubiquitin-protein ligase